MPVMRGFEEAEEKGEARTGSRREPLGPDSTELPQGAPMRTTATTRRTPITRTRVVAALVAVLALALPTGFSLTATASTSSAAPAMT